MEEEKRVLVVDDSASVRWQLRQALEAEGFFVMEAENGERALEVLEQPAPVHIMIVDVNMPVMNGYEMIRKARAMRKYVDTPIFVLTTESGPQAIKEGKGARATVWIIKPVKPHLLVAGMRKALGM